MSSPVDRLKDTHKKPNIEELLSRNCPGDEIFWRNMVDCVLGRTSSSPLTYLQDAAAIRRQALDRQLPNARAQTQRQVSLRVDSRRQASLYYRLPVPVGLEDRVAQIRDARVRKERQVSLEAGRINQAIDAEKVAASELKKQQEAAIKAKFVRTFTPLLEVIGARQQLEEVMRMPGWEEGVIDSRPEYTDGRLDLGITYQYYDLAETYEEVWNDESSSRFHSGSSITSPRVRFVVTVGYLGRPNIPMVGTYYGAREFGGKPIIWENSKCLIDLEPIPQNNPNRAKQVLQDQIVKILANEGRWENWRSPGYLASCGRGRIVKDHWIDQEDKHNCFSDLPNLPWYKRLLRDAGLSR